MNTLFSRTRSKVNQPQRARILAIVAFTLLGLRGALGDDTVTRIVSQAGRARAVDSTARDDFVRFHDHGSAQWMKRMVGNCCGNPDGRTGLDMNDFTCTRPGRAAAACVSDFRQNNAMRDVQSAYRRFLSQTPPEMRTFLTERCGGEISPGCLHESISQTDGNFLNDPDFYELSLRMNDRYPNAFDPNEVTEAARSWIGAVQALSVLTFACERVQGNFDQRRMRYTTVDPQCHTQPDLNAVPTQFIGTSATRGASGSLSDVELEVDHLFTSDTPRNRDQAVDLGEIASPFAMLESSCPSYISEYNSLRIQGQYAVACDPAAGAVSLAGVYQRYVDENLRGLLLQELAEEEVRVTASNLALVVGATSAQTGVSMDSFISEVRRACSGDASSLGRAFDQGLSEGREATAGAAQVGDALWRDIAGTVARVEVNSRALTQVEQQLRERCSFFESDIGTAFSGASLRSECYLLTDHRQRLIDFQQDAFRNYPFLAQRLNGSESPVWSQMSSSMGLTDQRRGQLLQRGATVTPQESLEVRNLYVRALRERMGQSLERVKTVCAHPQEEGLRNLNNPMIVGSFFDRDPGNRSAGWALCKAYADAHLSEQRRDIAWTAANIGTLFIPGIGLTGQITSRAMAWAAIGMAGASATYTASDLNEAREDALRNESQYLAGVGQVSDYLSAKASQDSFMSEVLQGGGLEAFNLAVTGLQVIPAVRGGAALLRLAETSGELGRTLDSARELSAFERNYRAGTEIAVRAGDEWSVVRVDEVLDGGRSLRVTDSRGVSRVIGGSAQVAHESRYVDAARDLSRTSERTAAQLTGTARSSGREVYIPRSAEAGAPVQMVEARVGQQVHVTLPDGSRVRGRLQTAVRSGEEVSALRVEVPNRGVLEVTDLPSVRVGQDTWVAPELLADYRTQHSRWYQAFGNENAEILDKIIDINTGREVMRDPAALAEITRLVGRVDLSQGLPARVLTALGDRASSVLARARARVTEELQRLGRGCGVGG